MIVEVAYALAEKQSLISLEVEEGATLKDAIEASGILKKYNDCLLYTSPSPRDRTRSRMPSSA